MRVFIGNFRSGTTLLVNLLGLHPEITPWFETKALCEPLRWLRVLHHPETFSQEAERVRPSWIPGFTPEKVALRMKSDFEETILKIQGLHDSGKGSHERYPIGADCMLASLDECLEGVNDWAERLGDTPSETDIRQATATLIRSLGAIECARSQKPLWINKTPEIPRFGSELRSCIGPSKMLLVIRDGRDVVKSARKLGWASEELLSSWWKDMIVESRAASRDCPTDYLEIRYESLVQDPVKTLDAIFAFLGISGESERLVHAYNAAISDPNAKIGRLSCGASAPCRVKDKIQGLDQDFLVSLGYDLE